MAMQLCPLDFGQVRCAQALMAGKSIALGVVASVSVHSMAGAQFVCSLALCVLHDGGLALSVSSRLTLREVVLESNTPCRPSNCSRCFLPSVRGRRRGYSSLRGRIYLVNTTKTLAQAAYANYDDGFNAFSHQIPSYPTQTQYTCRPSP
jgi:hypothetical protein